MAESVVHAGTPADGFGKVLWVPAIADPTAPKLTEISGGTVVDITYDLVGDGFRHEITENEITVNRYTLKQQLSLPGTRADSLELQYAVGTPAEESLTPGTSGFIVQRLGVANEAAFAVDQVVDVIPVTAGIQRKVAPTTNTELQKVQRFYVRGAVQDDVAVVAGA